MKTNRNFIFGGLLYQPYHILIVNCLSFVSSTCNNETWKCLDGRRCLEYQYVCDGVFHCTDGSDERDELCTSWVCEANKWKCDNFKCISVLDVCNKIYNCKDNSDEKHELCRSWECGEKLWKCTNNKCIPTYLVCNGANDCWGEPSDEELEMCQEWECLLGHWKCNDGSKCIRETEVCDRELQCVDGSDELNCKNWTCPEGRWKCEDHSCIDEFLVCRIGMVHSYEQVTWLSLTKCPVSHVDNVAFCLNWTCPSGLRKCLNNKQCVHENSILDGITDCSDSSDENAEDLGLTCSEGYFMCADRKKCIQSKYVCDGWSSRHDCKDGSDEANCKDWKCPSGFWKCENGQCIGIENVCDGHYYSEYWGTINECPDWSDEGKFCIEWECPTDKWKCADKTQCIKAESVCDGQDFAHSTSWGCHDKSDENNTLCGCKEQEWPCKNGDGCVPINTVCDGSPSCADESDEDKDFCKLWQCPKSMWKCEDNITCIVSASVCDGFPDCGNDEHGDVCKNWVCVETRWKCLEDLLCIEQDSVCDGKHHCSDGGDENKQFCSTYQCGDGRIKCADNTQCIFKVQTCNSIANCEDGSDELCNALCLDGPISSSKKGAIVRKCKEDNDVCFSLDRYCDRVPDCPFGSDEIESDCTCDGWGLDSCVNKGRKICFFIEWASKYNLSNTSEALKCEDILIGKHEEKRGSQSLKSGTSSSHLFSFTLFQL